jgi:predicted transcriptional regulator
MGMTTTNASYHLRMLERHHLVRSERVNGRRVYVPAGAVQTVQRFVAKSVLHRDSRASVARAIAARPGANQLRLAQDTGQHQGAVNWHLRRLVEAGLVTEERTPRECKYNLTPLGRELLPP